MHDFEKQTSGSFSSFDQVGAPPMARGMNDWAVPWADLMMVMFVLFVVLFIYASTHKDVKILFSQQSAAEAQATSTLDPLIGLIGQIANRVDSQGTQDIIRMSDNQVLYRSRSDGVSVIRESNGQIRVTLRGDLFFDFNQGQLKPESEQYLRELAEFIRLSLGTVHVVGYAAGDEAEGGDSFRLSTGRASSVSEYLMNRFDIEPKRIIVTGRGAYVPELPGTSQSNQALNRRVEIVITNTI